MEEIKELQEVVKEISEDAWLINKPDNVLTLQDALECVKQYEKHLQNEKKLGSDTIKNKYYISLKNKNKILKMSKSTITLKSIYINYRKNTLC